MREELEKRLDIIGILLGILVFVNYFFYYPLQEHWVLYSLMAISIISCIPYQVYWGKPSFLLQHVFFIPQLMINLGIVFLAPDLSVLIFSLLHICRFSSRLLYRSTVIMVFAYVLFYTGVVWLRDAYYGTTLSQYTPLVIMVMFVTAYLMSTLGNFHLRLRELAVIQDTLLKRTKGAIQFIDREGKTRILNKEAEVMYNISAQEAYGHYDYDLVYQGKKFDEQGNYTSLITETLETGKDYDGVEKATLMPSGEMRYHQIQTFRVYDEYNNVIGAMGIYRDITLDKKLQEELEATNAVLAQMSVTDAATEIFNYRYFQQRLKEEVEGKRQNIALLMIDVDNFKLYNDRNGHLAGNRVLKEVAQEIKANVRSVDVVVRYGGEEFAVILPGVGKNEAMEIALRLRAAIEHRRFEGEEKLPGGQLTISIGLAAGVSGEISGEKLLQEADEALYRSKAMGRNRVEVAG